VDIEIRINPAREPDRIRLNIAAGLRIVVAVVVVVEPGLGVEVLAGEPQVELEALPVTIGIFFGQALPKGLGVVPSPDDPLRLVGDYPRRIQVIGESKFRPRPCLELLGGVLAR
jgi:hypothetical protein